MNKKTPYIGITGFMNQEQVQNVLKNRNTHPSIVGRRLMVGVLVSSKTLQGIQNKWPLRYPKMTDLGLIFTNDTDCLNLVHFSSDNPTNLFDDLMQITQFAGENLHGFQLNMAWPDKEHLLRYKEKYPNAEFVLQVGHEAFSQKGNDLTQIYQAVLGYGGAIDHILLDMSGGRGLDLDHQKIGSLVSEFSPISYLGVGVAGGLSPENVQQKLLDIVNQYPDISIDAEGKLQAAHGGLDLSEVRKYLEASIPLFQGVRV